MKIIKLFLLLSFGLWADFKLDMPNIQSNIVDDVVKYGWDKADDDLKILFEIKGTKFLDDFKLLSTIPLKEQSDEEYLRENILSYSETSFIDPEEYGLPPKATEEEYLKQIQLTIKYDLKYMKYKRSFERDDYSYLMAYIKLLENKEEFLEAYDLYIRVIDRLSHVDNTVDITMLNGIRKIVFNGILINSLKESLSHKFYTKKQIQELSTKLKTILMLNENYWEQMMLDEKRQSLAYMRIAVIEVKSFEKFIDGMEKDKLNDSKIFEKLDYSVLKKYFENKATMEMALKIFSKKIDAHLDNLRYIKHDEDYVKLKIEYEKYIEAYFEKFDKKIGEKNRYELSKEEFIGFASEIMFGFSRSWKMGKNKRDFIERIDNNKKFIESLL